MASVVLAVHLATLGFDPFYITIAIALGLAGCAFGTLAVTFFSDRIGRRLAIAAVSLLMAAGGIALGATAQPHFIFLSMFVGMVNGMGRDRGACLTVEQAMLPQVTDAAHRTKTFAWYNVVVDVSSAVGGLLAFTPAFLRGQFSFGALASYRWTWGFYSALCVVSGLLALRLSKKVEHRDPKAPKTLSPESRSVIGKFALISGLDSFGGGFLSTTLLSYWFFKRFGVDEAFLGPMFFVVRVANGLSHLGAAWLAKRIGLVRTMVFTHLPSSVLLLLIPFASHLWLAVFLFLLRESLVEMDVPTRQSYVVAIVKEDERTLAAGFTNLTRSFAWAAAPAMAGPLMAGLSLSAPLWTGGGIKIIYDLILYREFRHIRPPEERPKNTR